MAGQGGPDPPIAPSRPSGGALPRRVMARVAWGDREGASVCRVEPALTALVHSRGVRFGKLELAARGGTGWQEWHAVLCTDALWLFGEVGNGEEEALHASDAGALVPWMTIPLDSSAQAYCVSDGRHRGGYSRVFELWASEEMFFIRAPNRAEAVGWVASIEHRASAVGENDLLDAADVAMESAAVRSSTADARALLFLRGAATAVQRNDDAAHGALAAILHTHILREALVAFSLRKEGLEAHMVDELGSDSGEDEEEEEKKVDRSKSVGGAVGKQQEEEEEKKKKVERIVFSGGEFAMDAEAGERVRRLVRFWEQVRAFELCHPSGMESVGDVNDASGSFELRAVGMTAEMQLGPRAKQILAEHWRASTRAHARAITERFLWRASEDFIEAPADLSLTVARRIRSAERSGQSLLRWIFAPIRLWAENELISTAARPFLRSHAASPQFRHRVPLSLRLWRRRMEAARASARSLDAPASLSSKFQARKQPTQKSSASTNLLTTQLRRQQSSTGPQRRHSVFLPKFRPPSRTNLFPAPPTPEFPIPRARSQSADATLSRASKRAAQLMPRDDRIAVIDAAPGSQFRLVTGRSGVQVDRGLLTAVLEDSKDRDDYSARLAVFAPRLATSLPLWEDTWLVYEEESQRSDRSFRRRAPFDRSKASSFRHEPSKQSSSSSSTYFEEGDDEQQQQQQQQQQPEQQQQADETATTSSPEASPGNVEWWETWLRHGAMHSWSVRARRRQYALQDAVATTLLAERELSDRASTELVGGGDDSDLDDHEQKNDGTMPSSSFASARRRSIRMFRRPSAEADDYLEDDSKIPASALGRRRTLAGSPTKREYGGVKGAGLSLLRSSLVARHLRDSERQRTRLPSLLAPTASEATGVGMTPTDEWLLLLFDGHTAAAEAEMLNTADGEDGEGLYSSEDEESEEDDEGTESKGRAGDNGGGDGRDDDDDDDDDDDSVEVERSVNLAFGSGGGVASGGRAAKRTQERLAEAVTEVISTEITGGLGTIAEGKEGAALVVRGLSASDPRPRPPRPSLAWRPTWWISLPPLPPPDPRLTWSPVLVAWVDLVADAEGAVAATRMEEEVLSTSSWMPHRKWQRGAVAVGRRGALQLHMPQGRRFVPKDCIACVRQSSSLRMPTYATECVILPAQAKAGTPSVPGRLFLVPLDPAEAPWREELSAFPNRRGLLRMLSSRSAGSKDEESSAPRSRPGSTVPPVAGLVLKRGRVRTAWKPRLVILRGSEASYSSIDVAALADTWDRFVTATASKTASSSSETLSLPPPPPQQPASTSTLGRIQSWFRRPSIRPPPSVSDDTLPSLDLAIFNRRRKGVIRLGAGRLVGIGLPGIGLAPAAVSHLGVSPREWQDAAKAAAAAPVTTHSKADSTWARLASFQTDDGNVGTMVRLFTADPVTRNRVWDLAAPTPFEAAAWAAKFAPLVASRSLALRRKLASLSSVAVEAENATNTQNTFRRPTGPPGSAGGAFSILTDA